MAEENLQTLLAEEWIYRGEGNANLVLSLIKKRKILRIPKIAPGNIQEESNSEHRENMFLDFYNYVMIPLLGKTYAYPALKVATEEEEIKKLDYKLLSIRPENRKLKRLKCGIATLWTDYAFLPKEIETVNSLSATFAVEIKPKQGWCFPQDVKYRKCQFCLNQYLKLQKSQIKQISSYCPMDLFSGVRKRMVAAIEALVENPQNNLRIFKDGVLIYDECSSREDFNIFISDCLKGSDDFYQLIYEALTKSFVDDEPCINCGNSWIQTNEEQQDGSCYFKNSLLPVGCVLRKILNLQQLYSTSLVEVYAYYQKLIEENQGEWDYLDNVLKNVTTEKSCPKCFVVSLARQDDLEVLPYLIAAIVNDCSLMVTFSKVQNSMHGVGNLVKLADEIFYVNVGIFDLYPKSLSTIEKHVKRNAQVEIAYKNYTEKKFNK